MDAPAPLNVPSRFEIYSSDEGRVQITAAAFAKGLLALDTHRGQLTPILASLVNKDAKLLDFVTHDVEEDILHSKHKLYTAMTKSDEPKDSTAPTEEDIGGLSQTLRFASLNKFKVVTQMVMAAHRFQNAGETSSAEARNSQNVTLTSDLMGVPHKPLQKLQTVYECTKSIAVQLRSMLSASQTRFDSSSSPNTEINWAHTRSAVAPRGSLPKGGLQQLKTMIVPAGGESFLLLYSRWKKLEQDLYHPRKARFDISKVPDVYDAAKYDAIHNVHLGLEGLDVLYEVAKELADCIVPNEYGTTASTKLRIGGTIANS
jgi:Histidine acid phosphatase.